MLITHTGPPEANPWAPALAEPACRLCGARLHNTLLDLGHLPLAHRTVAVNDPVDPLYRLHVRICDNCTLVQLADPRPPETPAETPAEATPAEQTHTRRYADLLRKRLNLDAGSLVIDIGANDGTLLRHFQAAGVPGLAVRPESGPFNTETAMNIAVRHGCADLVVADDILPQTPDLFDFAAGIASILRPNGVLTLQVPHLLALVQKMQFDAFRHDTYTYLSLKVLEHVLRSVGLRVFDAERLPDHAGSLRVLACHVIGPHVARPGLKTVRMAESFGELERRDFFTGFSDRVAATRDDIRTFLRTRRAAGRRVAAYGVQTRGTMLLNYCGITSDIIGQVADPDPAQHGRLLPGSRIPIVPVETLLDDPPDDLVILPWPHAAEIAAKLPALRNRGTQFWTALPRIARV